MSGQDKSDRPSVRPAQVGAGALAAALAALLGSRFGFAGSVTGAALASVISTVGTALFQHSYERTKSSVRARVVDRGHARTRVMPLRAVGGTPTTPRPQPHLTRTRDDRSVSAAPTVPRLRPAGGHKVGETTVWVRTGEHPTVASRAMTHRPGTSPVSTPRPARADRAMIGPPVPPAKTGSPARFRVLWALSWRRLALTFLALLVVGTGVVVAVESGLGESVWGGQPSTARVVIGGGVHRQVEKQQEPQKPGQHPGVPVAPESVQRQAPQPDGNKPATPTTSAQPSASSTTSQAPPTSNQRQPEPSQRLQPPAQPKTAPTG